MMTRTAEQEAVDDGSLAAADDVTRIVMAMTAATRPVDADELSALASLDGRTWFGKLCFPLWLL